MDVRDADARVDARRAEGEDAARAHPRNPARHVDEPNPRCVGAAGDDTPGTGVESVVITRANASVALERRDVVTLLRNANASSTTSSRARESSASPTQPRPRRRRVASRADEALRDLTT